MPKQQHRSAPRHGGHREAIRQVFDEFPSVLIDAEDEDTAQRAYAPPTPALPESDAAAQQRRGFFRMARRPEARVQPAAAAAPHHQAFEVERRAQRLDDALAAAREELAAVTGELEGALQRLAHAEAEAGAERSATAEWHATAAELNDHLDALRAEHEQLRHEQVALAGAFETERQNRQHWEHVASEQMAALDQIGAQLSTATADLRAEREIHDQTKAYAADLQQQLTTLHTQWEAHADELGGALAREREDYERTIEDERHTAEQARAEQVFQHREQVERLHAEATTAIDAVEQRLAEALATLETTTAGLGTTRADVVRLTEDLEAARGEALAANTRARELDDLRLRAEQRVEELGEELEYVRSEVMGSAAGKDRKRGMLRRGRPSPIKAAEKLSRPALVALDTPTGPVDPDVEDIIERRLFGTA
jgi:chromosome segregation ATPase